MNLTAIRAIHHDRPERIPGADAGGDVVNEATGRFRAGSPARALRCACLLLDWLGQRGSGIGYLLHLLQLGAP